jgi:hypothetical protein
LGRCSPSRASTPADGLLGAVDLLLAGVVRHVEQHLVVNQAKKMPFRGAAIAINSAWGKIFIFRRNIFLKHFFKTRYPLKHLAKSYFLFFNICFKIF